MSKVAVSIYGQIRGDEECWSSIKNNIIDPYCADVFVHSWLAKKNTHYIKNIQNFIYPEEEKQIIFSSYIERQQIYKDKINSFLETINPKICFLEEQKIFDNENYFKNNKVSIHYGANYQTIRSQAYSRKKSVELIENFQKENNINYDYIFQVRSDIVLVEIPDPPEQKTLFADYSNDILLDSLIYGCSEQVKILSKFYDEAEKLYLNYSQPFAQNEFYLLAYAKEKNILLKKRSMKTDSRYGDRGIKR